MKISQGTVSLRFFFFLPGLTRLRSCLIGDMIRVYVGPKRKRYSVHKALLAQHDWFRSRIYYFDSDLSRDHINLDLEDPEVFELLISWLYRKNLMAISTTNEKVAKKEATIYLNLYLRACEWDMHELQNALMDRVRVRTTCEYGFFPRKLVDKIYKSTSPASPLRSYIVDSFIFKGVRWDEARGLVDLEDPASILTRKRALKRQLDAGNQEFVLECYEALFKLCAKSRIRDPDRKTGCVYHSHVAADKTCRA